MEVNTKSRLVKEKKITPVVKYFHLQLSVETVISCRCPMISSTKNVHTMQKHLFDKLGHFTDKLWVLNRSNFDPTSMNGSEDLRNGDTPANKQGISERTREQ